MGNDLALLLFGILSAGIGWWRFRVYQRLNKVGKRVQGTIVDFSRTVDQHGNASYAPIVSFQTLTGEAVQAMASGLAHSTPNALGQQIPVRYDPARPSEFEIDTTSAKAGSLAFLAVITAVGVALIIAAFLQAARG